MAAGPSTSPYSELHFGSRMDVAAILSDLALSFVADRSRPKMLDLGCGSGAVSIAALGKRSDLKAVALDISSANIASARAAADQAGVSARLILECADYLTWRGDRFDVIVSDSVLHLIESGDAQLVQRLVDDLAPAGYLIATIPYACWANDARILLRRIWRGLPPAADGLALTLVRRLYPQFSREFLVERLAYLRVTPVRLFNDQLAAEFERQGLYLINTSPWPSPSAGKLDHKLLVWQKR